MPFAGGVEGEIERIGGRGELLREWKERGGREGRARQSRQSRHRALLGKIVRRSLHKTLDAIDERRGYETLR